MYPKFTFLCVGVISVFHPDIPLSLHKYPCSLETLNTTGALTGLFYQLDNNREVIIRERVLKFLQTKIQSLSTEIFTKEIQIFIFNETKKFIPVSNVLK